MAPAVGSGSLCTRLAQKVPKSHYQGYGTLGRWVLICIEILTFAIMRPYAFFHTPGREIWAKETQLIHGTGKHLNYSRGLIAVAMAIAMSLMLLGPTAAPQIAGAASPRLKPGTYYAKGIPVCKKPKKAGHGQCFAMRRVLVQKGTKGARAFTVNATPTPGPAGGLTPKELASAYGYSTSGGVGMTVGIVDAYNDPNILADLNTYDTNYGLPACGTTCLKVVSQTGSTTALPADDTAGWSGEETLDVEAVRAVCPNCKILLVETNSNSDTDLAAGVNEAVTLGAKVVSNSYGDQETYNTSPVQAAYNHQGVVITASTGDDGWFGWDSMNAGGASNNLPNIPAGYSTVVAVGGTSLDLNQSGGRASETVWNNNGSWDYFGQTYGVTGATGGGCSTLFSAQAWQSHVPGWAATTCGTKRLAADVSAVADPLTGFDIYDSYTCTYCGTPGWATYGGTSLASPVVAAMWALAGGAGGIKYPSLLPYGHLSDTTPSLYDVTVGGNGYCDGLTVGDCSTSNPNTWGYGMIDCDYTSTASPGTPSTGTGQCDAAPGYDGPSGVGTPIGLKAFQPAQYATITLPALLPVATAETFSASKSKDPYPGGTISSYSWSWGDGTANSTGVSPAHSYAAAGTYTITLTETDSYGAKSTAAAKVTLGAKPTAVITAPSTITHGTAATFSGAKSTDTNTDGKITSYIWSWGDGTANTTTSSSSVNHTYSAAGSYTVTLTVKDNYGNTSAVASTSVTAG